jgi:hypothetical protein
MSRIVIVLWKPLSITSSSSVVVSGRDIGTGYGLYEIFLCASVSGYLGSCISVYVESLGS